MKVGETSFLTGVCGVFSSSPHSVGPTVSSSGPNGRDSLSLCYRPPNRQVPRCCRPRRHWLPALSVTIDWQPSSLGTTSMIVTRNDQLPIRVRYEQFVLLLQIRKPPCAACHRIRPPSVSLISTHTERILLLHGRNPSFHSADRQPKTLTPKQQTTLMA